MQVTTMIYIMPWTAPKLLGVENGMHKSSSESYFAQQSWSSHSCLLNTTWIFWIDMIQQFW